MTRRCAGVVAPLAMAAALAGCGADGPSSPSPDAYGEWSAPATVLREDFHTTAAPRVAAGGREVAVIRDWEPTDGLRVARLGADGRWSAPERVPTLAPSTAHIGADFLGRLMVAWTAENADFPGRCVWVATRSGTGWSAPRTLACNAGESRLAVGPAGHALVAWSWSRFRGLAATPYDPAAGWQDGYAFANPDREVTSFDLAVDGDGMGAVTWHESSNGIGAIGLALVRGGRTLHDTVMREDLSFPREPRVAFESAGQAVLAWAGGYEGGIEASSTSATGGVTAGVTNDANDSCPDVAGSGGGTALLTWSRRSRDPGVFAATHVVGSSSWRPEGVQPAQPPLGPLCPVLEMDAQGNAVAAWTLQGTAGFDPEIWASIRPASTGRWAEPRRLAAEAVQPAVAITGGVAYVVWRALSGDLIQESHLRVAP